MILNQYNCKQIDYDCFAVVEVCATRLALNGENANPYLIESRQIILL